MRPFRAYFSDFKTGWKRSRRKRTVEVFLPTITDGLAHLLESGLPYPLALEYLSELADRPVQCTYIAEAQEAIQQGKPLSAAWRDAVPELLWILIQSGEQSGNLPKALRAWTHYVTDRSRWRKQVLKTLAYPSVLGILSTLLVTFVMCSVLPTFRDMYRELGLPMPPTIGLILRTLYVAPVGCVILFVVASSSLAGLYAMRRRVPRLWASVRRRLPGIRLLQLYRTNLFALLLLLLLDAGIPLVDALTLLTNQGKDGWQGAIAQQVLERVLNGETLSASFRGDWDASLSVFLGWAEKTGELVNTFEQVEHLTRLRLKERIDMAVRALEPALTLFMGLMVGFSLFIVFVPMYELVSTMSAGRVGG